MLFCEGEWLLDLADLCIEALDELTGDPDLEPSLGSVCIVKDHGLGEDQRYWASGLDNDAEQQCEGEGEPVFESCYWPDEGDQSDLGRGG